MDAVIFDMDGVLIDSQPYHYKADIATMSEYGVHKNEKFYEAFAGTTTPERMSRIKNMFSLEASVEEMTAKREQMILDIIGSEDICAVKGIPELLMSIKSKGMKTAVASSSSEELIHRIIGRLGISQYFDSVTSGLDAQRGKPAPDVFLLAAERIGVEPEKCVVIEDSAYGVHAAVAAGMTAIGYVNPTSGNQCLEGAKLIIDDFTKLDMGIICTL